MVQITKYQVVICFILSALFVVGQQLTHETPIYLMNQSTITYVQQITLLVSQLTPFILIVGWEERMQTGQGLNYFVRHKNRLQVMIKSYLHSTIIVIVTTFAIILSQIFLTKQTGIDYRWLGVICFYVMWHLLQRIIESYFSSVSGLAMMVGMIGFGLFVKTPILLPILFLFGRFSELNTCKTIIMLMIITGLYAGLGYIYRKKQVI
ncbi:hypothetical protein KII98_04475 [Leuconostoc gelidum subsp. gasicomitatum]|uniref:hypothetical protein n=1 Tax=Leuconostoc gasicomitatum TaxID=115778 RepID=UPI000744AB63|nr:hypothetical protein [Leuconostoc gasicomitatum]MBZ5953199.1 hypothetical protein [Leuconostoc gasicomitatum]MBZ5988543.1 hypothetical protein [Leuconostoc gasicomitatum]MBZ5990808.1 hypothetical protein [Leuconostoc gasicomitatum]CUR62705.1 Uncharacterized protein LEKG_0118 [Leuconostoc gasicomitatum KG16-1]